MSATIVDWQARKNSWVNAVSQLLGEIETWAQTRGWDVLRETKRLDEELVGNYELQRLTVKHPGGRLYVDPIGTNILGAEGRVDLENYPTLNTLLLILEQGKWQVFTDARVPWPVKWGRECFYEIVDALQH